MGALKILFKSSFSLKLKIDGETYTVLKCNYSFKMPTDFTTKRFFR